MKITITTIALSVLLAGVSFSQEIVRPRLAERETTKKQAVYARHQGMKKNNLPSINTKNLRIEELYKLNDNDFNKKQEEGVAKRVGKL